MGELLAKMDKQHGARGRKTDSHDGRPLGDFGINWTQSSRWQREADVPESVWLKHAVAVRAYAKVAGCRLKIQNDAACVKIDAECKAGELLKQMAERNERATAAKGRPSKASHHGRLLPEFGINWNQSSRWQREAAVPESVRQRRSDAVGGALEAIEKPKAKERKREHGGTAPGRKRNTGGKLPPVKQKTRDAVGAAVGLSGKSYERGKAVAAGR